MWRPSTPSLMWSSPTPFQRSPAGFGAIRHFTALPVSPPTPFQRSLAGFGAVRHFTALPVSSDTGRGRSSSGSCSKSPVPAATPAEAEPPVRTEAWVGDWAGAD